MQDYDDLWCAFASYAALQEVHLACFEAAAPPDLDTLTFERAHAFAELKNRLLDVVRRGRGEGQAAPLVTACQARLTMLLARDALLAERAMAYRTRLENELAHLRQGKKTLNAYGSLDTATAPRFVSTSS